MCLVLSRTGSIRSMLAGPPIGLSGCSKLTLHHAFLLGPQLAGWPRIFSARLDGCCTPDASLHLGDLWRWLGAQFEVLVGNVAVNRDVAVVGEAVVVSRLKELLLDGDVAL